MPVHIVERQRDPHLRAAGAPWAPPPPALDLHSARRPRNDGFSRDFRSIKALVCLGGLVAVCGRHGGQWALS